MKLYYEKYLRKALPLLGAYAACILLAIGLADMPSFLPAWMYTTVAVIVLLAVGATVGYTWTHIIKKDEHRED